MFKLWIETTNDAFKSALGFELDRILREVTQNVLNCEFGGLILDSNGNRVGEWTLKQEE